jgi:hypothetical protein
MPVWEDKPYRDEDGSVSRTDFFRREQNRELLGVEHWWLAVKGIQTALIINGGDPGPLDGWFGEKTERALKRVQTRLNLTSDGVWGPVTAKAVLRKLINEQERIHGIVGGYLCGMVKTESAFDLAAHAKNDLEDSYGLVQVNRKAHSEYTLAQIVSPEWNLRYAAKRVRSAYDEFRRRGAADNLAWKCAIAQHNSPRQAELWYKNRTPPSAQIEGYVDSIQRGC